MSKASRDKGKRGERRWSAWWRDHGFTPRSTNERGSVGHEDDHGADLELMDFAQPIRVQCKEKAKNCPSPWAMLESAHVACIHFTTGSLFSRDVLIMRADVFEEIARKVAAKGEDDG